MGVDVTVNANNFSNSRAPIIAVADVFQTLTQKRPYRDKFTPEDIMSILKNQMQEGKLDKDVVLMVGTILPRVGSWQIIGFLIPTLL